MSRVYSKLDRVLANEAWQLSNSCAEVCLLNECEFDHTHSLGLLTFYPRNHEGRKPFKYFTMWRLVAQFEGNY